MDAKRPLSEISHLFISELRSSSASGRPAPRRVPPPKRQHVSVDMTPEEFAASLSTDPTDSAAEMNIAAGREDRPEKPPRASIVISGHLGDEHCGAVEKYARQLAAEGAIVGLIVAGPSELNVTCFERGGQIGISPLEVDLSDTKLIRDNLSELSCDVDRWLIALSGNRTPAARELLAAAPHWVMLTTCDPEGVVSTYRALKGLSELGCPRVSLVVVDSRDSAHADAVFRRLDNVSRQFLHCGLQDFSVLRQVQNVADHGLLHARQTGPESTGHWEILESLLSAPAEPNFVMPIEPTIEEKPAMKLNISENPTTAPQSAARTGTMNVAMPQTGSVPEVVDLPQDASESAILEAVVRQGGADGKWITCPIHPPMCPNATLAVSRDQRLMLLAVAGPGLGQLLTIGQAHRWMSENTELIRMALPQLSIDSAFAPAVTLFVDYNDLSADVLQPLLQTGTVTVQAYRRIKWGGKTGLLLEAA